MNERILVVEDEVAIRDSVVYALEREGFRVDDAADGIAALETFRAAPFDLVLLDLMLPRLPGSEVCRRIRDESAVPIIMLTARDSEVDTVLGLEIGADDYMTKPFSIGEVVGRVRAQLRRRELDRNEVSSAPRRVGDLELDLARHVVRVGGSPVHLTPSEFRLLELMTREPERVFSRGQIMRHLWDSDYIGDQRACDTHVSNVRAKIERDPDRPERLVTVRGIGYKLLPV
jgi:two-component system, OmpR family, response regulator RegX3